MIFKSPTTLLRRAALGFVMSAMAAAVCIGCVKTEPGIEVEISVGADAAGVQLVEGGSAIAVTNNLGYEIEVQVGRLNVQGARIVSCQEHNGVGGFAQRQDGLVTLGQAHSLATPVESGDPLVVDLLDGQAIKTLGTLAPPPDRYCALQVSFLPADDDARSLPDDAMVGQTLRVSGRWRSPGQRWVPFSTHAGLVESINIPIAPSQGGLTLSERDHRPDLRLSIPVGHLFADVDFDTMEPEEIAALIMDNTLVVVIGDMPQ